ncbi:plantaricin C family lantibiotic [Clostridium vincentii]|uniref:Lantibiotic mersacidin n=1 Tax=Clostridium vincentii TaxID=52704 RepID=A0A2T0BHA9_9CLOT|nr:plantaricin C family lantibiotic [Clostridium vincentii]PRR83233.1 Lantibiotic mersacidin precursor [Clostridium vincentii]
MNNKLIKDPVLREKIKNIEEDPSGDAIAELTEQDLNSLAGTGYLSYLSVYLGNKGAYCTLTLECGCRR